MPVILPPPLPAKFLLPRPAIIRPATPELLRSREATFPFPVWSPRKAAALPTYVGHFSANVSGGTVTWASAPIATSAGDIVVIGFVRESNAASTNTSMTVGATTATEWSPSDVPIVFGARGYIDFYYCVPGALATANIVATVSGTTIGGNIFAWVLPGMVTPPLAVIPSASATSGSTVFSSVSTKIGGAVIAIGVNPIGSYTESWTGSESVIQDAQFSSVTGNWIIVACHFPTVATGSGNNLTLTISTSIVHIGGAITFGP